MTERRLPENGWKEDAEKPRVWENPMVWSNVSVVVVVSRRLYRTNRWNTCKYLFSNCHEQATLPGFLGDTEGKAG